VLDEYVDEDEIVLFVEGKVVALSALATAALFAVESEWTDSATIAAHLEGRFGEPPVGVDALEVAESTLRSLAELAIVELR
jgi:hypothetical protein